MKKVLSVMVALLLSVGGLTGCSSNSGGDTLSAEEVKGEQLYIEFIEAKIKKEDKDSIVVDVETNFPDDTEIKFSATNEEDISYKGKAVVSDGKLTVELEDESIDFVINGTYKVDAIMDVTSIGANSDFYSKYEDASSVKDLVDGEVIDSKHTSGYNIDFGTIGEIEITEGISMEEYNKNLEEAKNAREAERQAEKEREAKEEAERKAEEERIAKEEAERKAEEERIAKEKAEEEARKVEEEQRAKEEAEAKAEEERKASAEEIRFAELDKNPDKYKGEFVKYQGEIVQIIEGDVFTDIRLAVTKTSYGYSSSDIIYVYYIGTTPFVRGDIVTVYGEVEGSYTYESQAGFQITLPLILAETIE